MKLFFRRFSILFLCIQVILFSTPTFAMSWSGIKATATAAGAAVTGSATVGGATRMGAATVPWSAVKGGLSKVIGGGGLLGAALYAALGATNYTQDPATNSVVYVDPTKKTLQTMQQAWRNSWAQPSASNAYFTTPENACAALNASIGFPTSNFTGSGTYVSSTQFRCNFTSGSGSVFLEDNPRYSSSAVPVTSSITLPELVQLLIDQMGNNSAAIKNVLDQLLETAIAQAQTATNIDADLKAMLGALTAALDNAATYAGSGTANGTQTTTATGANLKLDFPVFCGWAGIVCEAAQTAINFPTTVGEWWKTVVEWNKTIAGWYDAIISKTDGLVQSVKDYWKDPEPDTEDHTVNIDDPTIDKPNINVNFGSNTCPSYSINFNLGFVQRTVDLSPIWLCQIAEGMKPFVIAAGIYTAALIVGKREN